MSGHGHVIPNPDGTRARCGGPGFCPQCSAEAARVTSINKALPPGVFVDLPGFRPGDPPLPPSPPGAAPDQAGWERAWKEHVSVCEELRVERELLTRTRSELREIIQRNHEMSRGCLGPNSFGAGACQGSIETAEEILNLVNGVES